MGIGQKDRPVRQAANQSSLTSRVPRGYPHEIRMTRASLLGRWRRRLPERRPARSLAPPELRRARSQRLRRMLTIRSAATIRQPPPRCHRRSRPSCTLLRMTLSLLSRVAICVPWSPVISAVDGTLTRFASVGNLEVHIAVAAAEEFSSGIVGLQLDLHAVRILIYRLGDVRHTVASNRAPRVLRHFERRLHANGQPGRKTIAAPARRCERDAGRTTSNSGWPEPPELISMPSSTFRAVTTPSNGAASVLKRLHGLELPDIGFVGVDDGLLCLGVGVGLVGPAVGPRSAFAAGVVTVRGQRCDLMIGPDACQASPWLGRAADSRSGASMEASTWPALTGDPMS